MEIRNHLLHLKYEHIFFFLINTNSEQSTEHRAHSTENRAQSTEHIAQSIEHREQSTEKSVPFVHINKGTR